MDELDLVLSQDMRKINGECAVFEIQSFINLYFCEYFDDFDHILEGFLYFLFTVE